MPAVSKEQKTAACMALAAKKGKISVDKLQASSKGMYESMSEEQLVEYCGSKVK